MTLDGGDNLWKSLLTGYPEPMWNAFAEPRRNQSLTPFSKLARPSWAAAALACLKDLGYLESWLRTSRETAQPSSAQSGTDTGDRPEPKAKSKFKPRKPSKGGNEGAN